MVDQTTANFSYHLNTMLKNLLAILSIASFSAGIISCADTNNSDNSSVAAEKPCFTCADTPEGVIFCDDFESNDPLENRYFEYNSQDGSFVRMEGVGVDSSAGMRVRWAKGQVTAGDLKKSLGRSPDPYRQATAASPDETFTDIYWRIDVRYQEGWTGGGADKLSRATTLLDGWRQGMIAHVWSGGKPETYNFMTADPASGIDTEGNVVSTKYNDFDNLRWLGSARGNTDLFSEENAGKWHCVVAHARLNSPGESDGIFEFWINGVLQARKENLNWHGAYNSDPENFGINAIFFENYWNAGSPKEQERYFDNIVIATEPLDCQCNEKL